MIPLMYVNKDKVVRWKKMPVSIFLPQGSNITYRPEYYIAAIRGLNMWKLKSNGEIDYVLIDDRKKADIEVIWQDNYMPESEGEDSNNPTSTGRNLNQVTTGNVISSAGMFVPGYYGYGASLLGYLVGSLGNNTKIKDVKMRIGTLPAMKLNKENAANLIQSMVSREFGRAIGITCNSINHNDIMFYQLPLNGSYAKIPTHRDVNTAVELYEQEPDITN